MQPRRFFHVWLNVRKMEDTLGVISPNSKGMYYNGQKKKDKRTNNDLQYTTQKIKY